MGIPSTEKGLPRLGLIHVWGIAVGSSIGGDFVGWNSGLQAGLGGALVGLGVSTILYGTLALSIAEMGAHSAKMGGSHTFVGESPLGRLGAYLTGVAELLKIVPTGCAFALGIQAYVMYGIELGGPLQKLMEVGVWVILYFLSTLFNTRGTEISANAQLVVTLASLAVLVAFYVLALPSIDFHKYALSEGRGWFWGSTGTFLSSLPYSLEYYMGLESVPLLAGSVQNPSLVMPRAIVSSMATLGAAAILTLILNSSVAPGVEALQHSSAPLLDGFRALTQNPFLLSAASAMISAGLIVGFHVFVLFAGETVAMLAKDGILPAWLGASHPRHGTPHVALLGSSALGLALLGAAAHAFPPQKCMSVLINMAVCGALVAYLLQFAAYLSRPWAGSTASVKDGFRSPLGHPGACAGFAAACLLLLSQFVHAARDTAEAEGLLVAGSVFVAALAFYRWGPARSTRAVKAARAARTHADSLADEEEQAGGPGPLYGPPDRGKDEAARALLDPFARAGAAGAWPTTPQRRRPAGAWGSKGSAVAFGLTPAQAGATAAGGAGTGVPSSLWSEV